jgi:hypothetical protein
LDYRPAPDAEFVVEVLNDDGSPEIFAYIAGGSNEVVAVIHARKGRLPIESHGIPPAVIETARQCRIGFAQYVNDLGEIVVPSFLPQP